MKISRNNSGFTIVELLIVIVIIGILATIVIVAYNGITTKARQSSLQSDLANSRTKLEMANATDGSYPLASTVTANKANYLAESKGNTLTYKTNPAQDTYCLSAKGSDNITYVVSNLTNPTKGSCTGTYSEVATAGTGVPLVMAVDGTVIQTITTSACPTINKIRAVDARDNHTYWVQKLTDGKCWMLTNLSYAGGGNNSYGDTMSTSILTDGTGSPAIYTEARFYISTSGTNITVEPANPSTSTTGAGQYGYLYNWCAAMGGQNTAACSGTSTTPVTNPAISICPSGWRLPTANGGEYGALNAAVNSGSTSTDTGLRNVWLGQRSGNWNPTDSTFGSQGTYGFYWPFAQALNATSTYGFGFSSTYQGSNGSSYKSYGFAVRCLAAA